MALQGTLDTFALADLVRLLATTEKTGELAIDGDRGQGRLWFDRGDIVAGEPAASGDVADALFALLRMEEGDFRFDADVAPAQPGDARRALDVLEAAEERLEAWKPVEALVPSPAVTLSLRAELPEDEVRLDRATWSRLVAAAGSATAADLGAALDLDEVATAFAIRDLVETGLVEVGEPAEATAEVEDLADVVALAPAPADEVFVPVEIEDVPLPGEAEVLALREQRRLEAEAEAATALAEETTDEVADVADVDDAPEAPAATPAWGADDAVPTLSSAAELLSSGSSLGEDAAGLDAGPLGTWEPLMPAADDAEADVAPAAAHDDAPATLAEALPPIEDSLPSLDEAPAGDALPSLDSAPVPGSLAVDLDAQLGGPAADHSYLDRAPGGDVLPEPLPSVPVGGAEALPAEPVADTETDDRAPWPAATAGDDLSLDALSPAAAAAVAAAANDDGHEEVEAGRRVLRRIISTGKG